MESPDKDTKWLSGLFEEVSTLLSERPGVSSPCPHWMPHLSIKWASVKEVSLSREGLLYLWRNHSLSPCFTTKPSFTVNSMLAQWWIPSCMKPGTHSGSQTPGSPGARTPASSGLTHHGIKMIFKWKPLSCKRCRQKSYVTFPYLTEAEPPENTAAVNLPLRELPANSGRQTAHLQ